MSRRATGSAPSPDDTSVDHTADSLPLAAEWQALFGSVAPTRLDHLLTRAVAWKRQVEANEDVSRAIREDLRLIARDIRSARLAGKGDDVVASEAAASENCSALLDVPAMRHAPPPLPPASSSLLPGARLMKTHGGKTHVVEVLTSGFRYDGEIYASLSAIAKAITGTHWNGLLFFGLRRRKTYPKKATG